MQKYVEQEEKLRLNWFYLGLLVSVTVTSLPYIWMLLDKVWSWCGSIMIWDAATGCIFKV